MPILGGRPFQALALSGKGSSGAMDEEIKTESPEVGPLRPKLC